MNWLQHSQQVPRVVRHPPPVEFLQDAGLARPSRAEAPQEEAVSRDEPESEYLIPSRFSNHPVGVGWIQHARRRVLPQSQPLQWQTNDIKSTSISLFNWRDVLATNPRRLKAGASCCQCSTRLQPLPVIVRTWDLVSCIPYSRQAGRPSLARRRKDMEQRPCIQSLFFTASLRKLFNGHGRHCLSTSSTYVLATSW